MANKQNTNSFIIAFSAILGLVSAVSWQGLPGFIIYISAFFIGGVGTIINYNRSRRNI